ncbi:MAG: hypothetical protein PF637_07420 [Spirochaetes bacterium]|jgi:hypothetical protein|nr:hypothetical protein [Spirochaetota bacterium]
MKTIPDNILATIIFMFVICNTIVAQDTYDSLFEDMQSNHNNSGNSDNSIKIHGTHKTLLPVNTTNKAYAYTNQGSTPASHNITLDVRRRGFRIFSDTSLTHDMTKNSSSSPDTIKNDLTLKETYAKFSNSIMSLDVGYIIYSWGSADSLNPTDTLNPRDDRNPYSPEKLAVSSAALQVFPSSRLHFEFVLIPYTPDALQQHKETDYFNGEMFIDAGSQKSVTYKDNSRDPGSTKFAIRGRAFLNGADLSLSYVYDIDSFYTPDIDFAHNEFGIYKTEKIQLYHDSIHRLGADLKITVSRFGLWSETCLSVPESINKNKHRRRKSEIESTMGIDTSYGRESRGYVSLQYNIRYIPDYDNSYFDDYTQGMPDNELVSDADYMQKYYYRSITKSILGQYSRQRHTLMLHNRWSAVVNRFDVEVNLGGEIPVDTASDNNTCRQFTLLSNIKGVFTIEDALIFEAGLCHSLPLRYDRSASEYRIDNNAETASLYRSNYIYAVLSFKWSSTTYN